MSTNASFEPLCASASAFVSQTICILVDVGRMFANFVLNAKQPSMLRYLWPCFRKIFILFCDFVFTFQFFFFIFSFLIFIIIKCIILIKGFVALYLTNTNMLTISLFSESYLNLLFNSLVVPWDLCNSYVELCVELNANGIMLTCGSSCDPLSFLAFPVHVFVFSPVCSSCVSSPVCLYLCFIGRGGALHTCSSFTSLPAV